MSLNAAASLKKPSAGFEIAAFSRLTYSVF